MVKAIDSFVRPTEGWPTEAMTTLALGDPLIEAIIAVEQR
jgi:hypothetical protein